MMVSSLQSQLEGMSDHFTPAAPKNSQGSLNNLQWVSIFVADIGFEVPDAFLVGYALDYNEYFRDLSVSDATPPHKQI